MDENAGYDDGSYGPVLLRLAWHTSGTYDKTTKDGGSCKGTMRFEPESKHDANAGLNVAREKLEKIKQQFPWISYGDLWTLGGVVAVQEMVNTVDLDLSYTLIHNAMNEVLVLAKLIFSLLGWANNLLEARTRW